MLVVTQDGLNQAVSASNQGINIKITHVAFGTEGYEPDKEQTSLRSETVRAQVAGGQDVSPNQVHLTAVFDGDEEVAAREIGFFLEDGTLFAVESDPNNVLIYKNQNATIIQAFDLVLDATPPSSVTVDITGDLNMFYGTEFSQFATSINRISIRELQMSNDIEQMKSAINRLGQTVFKEDLV